MLSACGGANQSTEKTIRGPRGDASLMNEHPDSLYNLGLGFEKSGDIAQALSFYGQATAAAPSHVSAWLGIGRLLKQLNNKSGARLAFEDALAANSANVALTLAAVEIEILDTGSRSCSIRIKGTYDGKPIDVTVTVEADNCAVAAGQLLKEFAK